MGVLSLYALLTNSGIVSPSAYDFIEKPASYQRDTSARFGGIAHRECRMPARAAGQIAILPSSVYLSCSRRPCLCNGVLSLVVVASVGVSSGGRFPSHCKYE